MKQRHFQGSSYPTMTFFHHINTIIREYKVKKLIGFPYVYEIKCTKFI